jgi:hypothetical protein
MSATESWECWAYSIWERVESGRYAPERNADGLQQETQEGLEEARS